MKTNYLFVRKDLPLAQQLVQASHAAHESGVHFCNDTSKINHLVLFEVSDEHRLLKAYDRLSMQGIRSCLFREPDMGDEATSCCTEPLMDEYKFHFSKYRLWRA